MLPIPRVRFLFVQFLAAAILVFPGPKPDKHRPSLDDLVVRASAYWELLAKGQKSRALEYVQPQTRETFLDRQTPAFSEPRVTRLDLAKTPAETWVTVTVKRILPLIPTPVDWPVKEKWVFEGDKWVVVITKSTEKFARVTEAQPRAPAANPDQEKQLESIRNRLHFESSKIEFGTVRQGQDVPIELKYQLTGSEPLTWKLEGAPRGLTRKVAGSRELTPGEAQKIELGLATPELDGEILETFTIAACVTNLELPYEFSIHGYVYAPVSISPRDLKFLKGEATKEVTLRNNSKSPIQIVTAKSAELNVQTLPQTLAPGAECRLTVGLKFPSYGTNHDAVITLQFAEPADGVDSVSVPVIVNFEPPKPWRRFEWEEPLTTPKAPH